MTTRQTILALFIASLVIVAQFEKCHDVTQEKGSMPVYWQRDTTTKSDWWIWHDKMNDSFKKAHGIIDPITQETK